MPLAPPPLEKGLEKGRSPSPALSRARRVGINARAGGDQCTVRSDPHPARKSAPTSPFQGEVEQAAHELPYTPSEVARTHVICHSLRAVRGHGWRPSPLTDSPPLLYSRLGAHAPVPL